MSSNVMQCIFNIQHYTLTLWTLWANPANRCYIFPPPPRPPPHKKKDDNSHKLSPKWTIYMESQIPYPGEKMKHPKRTKKKKKKKKKNRKKIPKREIFTFFFSCNEPKQWAHYGQIQQMTNRCYFYQKKGPDNSYCPFSWQSAWSAKVGDVWSGSALFANVPVLVLQITSLHCILTVIATIIA